MTLLDVARCISELIFVFLYSSIFPRWVGVMSRAAQLGSIIIPRYYPDQCHNDLIM